MLSRRAFIKYSVSGAAALGLAGCLPGGKKRETRLTFRNDNSARGHRLWSGDDASAPVSEEIRHRVVIIGAGISGLSAAYHLKKSGISDLAVYELADHAGGNSASGKNEVSEFPYGAHYLTLPNPDNKVLMDFLYEKGIITGFDGQGRPVYNETDLCFDPEERLFMRGVFQEGLVPHYGLSEEDKKETEKFFRLVGQFREQKGADGLYFFNIPASASSTDPSLDHLDAITFRKFLTGEGFKNEQLLWYLDYCCRDDYGGGIDRVSAWAGINYFAAHRANPANTDPSRILTWPEGNARLASLLAGGLQQQLHYACLVSQVLVEKDKVSLKLHNFSTGKTVKVICDACIVAVPPFVAARLIAPASGYPVQQAKQLEHAPWLVASVVIDGSLSHAGSAVCWDNVAYGAASLGYIFNQHQSVRQHHPKSSVCLYMPLDEEESSRARKKARERDLDHWKKLIVEQLSLLHPGIEERIEAIEVCIWGHGMILPRPGLTKGPVLKQLSQPIEDKLFFAHTDLSGYSIFEEGFDQGLKAAQQVLSVVT